MFVPHMQKNELWILKTLAWKTRKGSNWHIYGNLPNNLEEGEVFLGKKWIQRQRKNTYRKK